MNRRIRHLRILAALQSGPVTFSEIWAHCQGRGIPGRHTVRRALQDLVASGAVQALGDDSHRQYADVGGSA